MNAHGNKPSIYLGTSYLLGKKPAIKLNILRDILQTNAENIFVENSCQNGWALHLSVQETQIKNFYGTTTQKIWINQGKASCSLDSEFFFPLWSNKQKFEEIKFVKKCILYKTKITDTS